MFENNENQISDDLLTQQAERITDSLRANPAMLVIAKELLEGVSKLSDFAHELTALADGVFYTARRAEEDGELLDYVHEFYARSECILAASERSGEFASWLLDIVRELAGEPGADATASATARSHQGKGGRHG